MADKPTSRSPYAFTPVILDQESHEKRRIIKQLPGVHQTETLTKFFGASADHLFDPGKGKPINGYVGQKPLWYDPDQDYYLEEGTTDRTFYQLEASMVSKNTEGALTDLLPYPDLINQLRFQGALTNNHNRLFSQDFYTWCPPIDLDKIVNFRQYCWLPIDDVEPVNTFFDGPNGWVLSDGSPAPTTGPFSGLSRYLGSFAGTPNGAQVVSKRFTLNNNSNSATLAFDFVKLNSWDAVPGLVAAPQAYGPESLTVYLNDQEAFRFTPVGIGIGGASQGSGKIDLGDIQGTYLVTSPGQEAQLDADNVGPAGDPWQGAGALYSDRVYQVTVELQGTGKTLKVGFGSNTDEPLLNESLGLDNFAIRQSSSSSSTVRISGPTRNLVSDGTTATYELPGYGSEDNVALRGFYDLSVLNRDLINASVDGVPKTFQYSAGQNTLTFDERPATDAEVSISVYSDLENNAVGLPYADPVAFGGVTLSSGMRVSIINDKNTDYAPNKVYIVEQVGKSIELLDETLWGTGSAVDYLVMGRGAANRNEWSVGNRWFHVSTLPDSIDPEYVASRRATRPIIEFNRDLELYRYGGTRRLDVDMVVEDIEDLNGYMNLTPNRITLNGVMIEARNGLINVSAVNPNSNTTYGDVASIRLLVRNTVNPLLNNQILVVTNQGGVLKLILETDGSNPTGEPVFGEVVKVLLGKYGGKNLYWNGSAWLTGQHKTGVNQAPLFELYDLNRVSLRDEYQFPNSTFQGNRLFSYKQDTTGTKVADPVLGMALVHDNKGQILFQNYLSTENYQYVVGGKYQDITGFYFHKTGTDDAQYSNDWFKADGQTRQYMIDRYVSDGRTRLFHMSQDALDLHVTVGRVNESKSFERVALREDIDFIRVNRDIMIFKIKTGDIVEIRTFNTANPPLDAKGHYEIPLNLQANPDNQEVAQMTKGDFYDHFSEIMRKQPGFTGAEYSANNYRDTPKLRNLGTHVIQHSAGLLKTMLLASQSQLDITAAIRYSDSEYARFKDKFQQKILDYSSRGRLNQSAGFDLTINTALDELNKGKTKHFSYYRSGMAQNENNQLPTFIPPTPSYLGLYPLYTPEMISQEVSDEQGNQATVWFIRGHDGSLTQSPNESTANVLLALEQRIFDSVPANVRNRERPVCDWQTAYGDQYRVNDYSYDEYLAVLRPSFERWAVAYQQDSRINDNYDDRDPWTWNWSSQKVPGHWRGIYEKFFGTQRPDLTPWESLGFTIKPDWWDDRYGPAPYTSENLVLWDDLEQGYIHEGSRQGINAQWARPGLSRYMPVDLRGRLRHPGPRNLVALNEPEDELRYLGSNEAEDYYTAWEDENNYGVLGCGICPIVPLHRDRAGEWNWGDLSPVEQTWRRSSTFAFAAATAGYLMKPAQFVEMGWNTEDLNLFFKGTENEQWLNQDTNGRPSHRELQVHGEVLEDLTIVRKTGIQQWVSDYLSSSNTDINTNFADKVRGLGSQLSYKVAGFTDASTLVVVSDAFGRVPSEDVTVSLYRSPSVREETYSGLAIEYTGRGYEIYGYDAINPHFPTIAGAVNGNKISVGNGSKNASVPDWKPSTYYAVNLTLKYDGSFYRCTKSHTSSVYFETEYWTQVARPQYADGSALTWYLDSALDAPVVKVPYGTVLKTPQDVANFINGYERYLKSRGWKFESLESDSMEIKDWRASLTAFITWSNNDERVAGDYLALSPCSSLVQFSTDQGAIQPIEQIVNGLYAVVDQNGQPIDNQITRVIRNDGDISVSCNDAASGIFGLRLYISELEHVLVFNNSTIFGDTIYSPLLNIHQPRLRLQGFKTVGWKGRVDAPGFIVTGDTLVPNFERAADDFRRFFEVESMENKKLQDRARANFGYEEREYLNNLLLTPTNQFEFYQGMIQQKGSSTSMRRLLRSNFVRHNKGLKLFEEWAFRVGDYGGQEVTPQLDVQILQSEFKHNPQLVSFEQAPLGSSVVNALGQIKVIDYVVDGKLEQFDARWHWRPDMQEIQWPVADYGQNDASLPTAGPVNLDEVRFTVPRHSDFNDLFGNQEGTEETLVDRDRVWVYGIGEGTPQSSWSTHKFSNTNHNVLNVFRPSFEGQGTVVQVDRTIHGWADASTDPWNTAFYITQPLLENARTAAGMQVSGERLMFRNLQGSDVNPLTTYRPQFCNKVTQYLDSNSRNEQVIMGLYPEAYQLLKSIRVTVLEAFQPGALLSIGHDSNPDAFVAEGIVDLTRVGTYESSRATGSTLYPYNVAFVSPDRNLISNLINDGIEGRVKIEVEYFYIRGFELVEEINGSFSGAIANDDGGTAQIYTWIKTRYPTFAAIPNNLNLWQNGDIVEVDSGEDTGRWSTYKMVNSGWQELRRQNRKINSKLLTSAAIFNSKENKLKLVLQLYDPYKGFIPGAADRELEYKTVKDPATYDDGRLIWGKEQVGKLWWDISAVRYLDYEINDNMQGGISYRWKNWGRIAPGSTVDIYQWVRSTVLPNSWNEYVESIANQKITNKPSGRVVDEQQLYITATEWNDDLSVDETVYYFWVLNPTTVPSIPGRTLSGQQVSNIIANPSANDIPFFAVIDTNKVIVGGIKQFLNETDTVLKVKWTKESEIINNHHKQWIILREQDERNTINDALWLKMRDSLVGWDSTELSVPDLKLPKAQQIGAAIRPRQSWYPADVSPLGGQRPSRGARAAFVDVMNNIMSAQPFIDQWYNWADVFDKGEDLPTSDRYVAIALDLADLDLLLPASRNQVLPGECVLVQNTTEAAGFWTLWKMVDTSGVRSWVLEDFQKWRMQEGELWNLADWYASDWSPKNFPNYRFPTYEARDAAGNLDVTLLKGTLVQIDQQSPSDLRWSWDVYTNTTKYQVAKSKSTIKLSDAFYDNSRVEFGPKEIKGLLASQITPARIQELANVINFRDGAKEIQFILDSMKVMLFDTLQRNELFFSMVKSTFKQSQVVDWAFKTSFLYLGGYSEVLRQSPVAFKDQIDNVISYLEEVKPYHVKIREYVRRLSYGPDLAALAITDFDKPVYPDGAANRVLDETNPADLAIMDINRPWKDWKNNYQKDNYDLSKWDSNWNPIRRSKITVKYDRISCGAVRGWDTSPWDPALLVYSQLGSTTYSLSGLSQLYRAGNAPGANFYNDQTVETIEERNFLVRKGIVTASRPGTIVTVLQDTSHWMWSGSDWIKFEALGWDKDPDMGTASRVEAAYRPLPGMQRADDPGLIAGCEFDGTTITDSFALDAWDIFEWDSTGYSQGIRELTGRDQESLDGNTTAADEADPANIRVTGNKFSQAAINGGRPHELVNIRGIESMIINVQKSGAGLQKSSMNARGHWETVPGQSTGLAFVAWDQNSKTVSLSTTGWTEDAQGYSPLHDPQNPSTGFVRDVMISQGYRSSSQVDMSIPGSKSFKLRDTVDEIPAGLRGNNVKVAVVNPRNPSKRAIGVLTNSKGDEKNWSGSLDITFTDGFVDIGSGKSWNIIPLDSFNTPGVVWIGNARFTYTGIEVQGNAVLLNNARLSANTLAPLTISETEVSLSATTPVLDGSKQRQRAE